MKTDWRPRRQDEVGHPLSRCCFGLTGAGVRSLGKRCIQAGCKPSIATRFQERLRSRIKRGELITKDALIEELSGHFARWFNNAADRRTTQSHCYS